MARSVFLCTTFPCKHYQESGTHVGLLGGSSLDLLGLALLLRRLLVGRFLVRRLLLYNKSQFRVRQANSYDLLAANCAHLGGSLGSGLSSGGGLDLLLLLLGRLLLLAGLLAR
jgi:hypothetical protein